VISTLNVSGAVVLLALSCSIAQAGPIYMVRDLGPVAGCCGPYRISDNGTVSGSIGPTAVAWSGDSIQPLWTGIANDINSSGQIAGLSEGQAVVWSNGVVRVLGSGAANAISNSGLVAGSSGGVATAWDQTGTAIALADLGANDSAASGINNGGHVVGTSRGANGETYRAVEWINGVVNELPSLCIDVQCQSFANDINNAGQITGQTGGHAVIWLNGVLIDLGTLGGSNTGSTGVSINDFGWVVGDASGFGSDPSAAFVFDGVTMHDLNKLVVGPNPFSQLTAAAGINNRGEIVGFGFVGGQVHPFIATRVPEPSTLLLSSFGFVVVCGKRVFANRRSC
jgi:probable HAF family extracellular repeat protein